MGFMDLCQKLVEDRYTYLASEDYPLMSQAKMNAGPPTLARRSELSEFHELMMLSNSVLFALWIRVRASLAVSIFLGLTKSRVEHIECHLIALGRASNSDKSLVTVVLRFVDLDDAATEMSDLIDFGTTLANNGTDHVVGDEDLLCDRLTWHGAWHLRMSLALGTSLGHLTVSWLGLWATIAWLARAPRRLRVCSLRRVRLVWLWC